MLSFVARRLLIATPVLFGILVIAFAMVRLLPGSPGDMMVPPDAKNGPHSETFIREAEQQLGLDKPVVVQFFLWLGKVLTGDLGYSYSRGDAVLSVMGERLPPTALLGATAIVVALLVAIPIGVWTALRRNTWIDYVGAAISMLAVSVPAFFLGLVAIFVFAVKLEWLPSGGMQSFGDAGSSWDLLRHLLLPALTLAAVMVGPYVRYARASMLDVMGQEYITTAVAKGAPWRRVVWRHGLRNSLLPLVAVLALQVPGLLAGAVIVESVFAWPGVGGLTLEAIAQRDYPVILGIVLLSALAVLLFSILADVVTAWLDPRIRL